MSEVLLSRALEAAHHLKDPAPPWEEVLRTASSLMGTDGAVFIVQRQGRVDIQQVGADPSAVSDYTQHFHTQDVLLSPGMAAPVGSWLDTYEILSHRDRARGSYYNDFMCRHHMRQLGSFILTRESPNNWSSLGVQREYEDPGLAERMASARVSHYLHALNEAVKARSRNAEQWLLSAETMFERMEEAVLLVSPTGAIVQASGSTREKLRDAGLLKLGELWHAQDVMRSSLRMGLAQANSEKESSITLRVPGATGELLQFSLVKAAAALRLLNEDLVFVRVRFPHSFRGKEIDALRRSFSLTLAEARVLYALVCGKIAKEYAGQEGVSIHTVRKQIATLMQKMNCSRQLELVQKAMTALGH